MKAKLTWIGLAALAVMPWLPPEAAAVVQELAGIALVFALVVWLFARFPMRTLLRIVRLFYMVIAGFCGFAGAKILLEQSSDRRFAFSLFGLGALLVFAAVEPSIRRFDPRNRIGRLQQAAWIGTMVMFAMATVKFWTVNDLLWATVVSVYCFHRVGRKGGLESSVERMQWWAVRTWNDTRSTKKWRPGVEGELAEMRFLWAVRRAMKVPAEERYSRQMEICLHYPQVELAMRLAYATAVRHQDWATAKKVVRTATEAGWTVGSTRTELMPHVAERLGPRWQEILLEDDVRAILAGDKDANEERNASTVERWRQDPKFAELEAALATSAPLALG